MELLEKLVTVENFIPTISIRKGLPLKGLAFFFNHAHARANIYVPTAYVETHVQATGAETYLQNALLSCETVDHVVMRESKGVLMRRREAWYCEALFRTNAPQPLRLPNLFSIFF